MENEEKPPDFGGVPKPWTLLGIRPLLTDEGGNVILNLTQMRLLGPSQTIQTCLVETAKTSRSQNLKPSNSIPEYQALILSPCK